MELNLEDIIDELKKTIELENIFSYEYEKIKDMLITNQEEDEERECLLSHYRNLCKKYQIEILTLKIKLLQVS